MAWDDRTQSSRVTGTRAWSELRLKVLERDNYECQIKGSNCFGHANQVDHKRNTKSGGTNAIDNLQAACQPCNMRKAQTESVTACNANRQQAKHPGTRERHPGTL